MVRRELKLHVQAFIAALQFLTRFPISVSVPFQGAILSRSVIYFPAAGALIGVCLFGMTWLLALFAPPWPSAVVVLALWTALSGGLHLDGWMDTADGVLSHRSRERMLEIMKDSRVGAMGVLAAVLLLLFKASLLAYLLEGGQTVLYGPLLVIAPIWSRAWMSAAIAGWPNARQGEGIAVLFNEVKWLQAATAFILAAVISSIVFWIVGVGANVALIVMLITGMITIGCGGFLAAWLNRKLGGLTGDTYGAMNEAIEAAILFGAVIWLYAQ